MGNWHIFHGTSESGLRMQITLEDDPRGPDAVLASGERLREHTIPVPDYGLTATWVATFTHPPTDAELAGAGIPIDSACND